MVELAIHRGWGAKGGKRYEGWEKVFGPSQRLGAESSS